MKHLYTLAFLSVGLLVSSQVSAQQDSSASFTLDQCIQYALTHSINNQNASLDEQIASAKVKETIGIGLPQISASGSVVHNPTLPRFYTTFLDADHRAGSGITFIPDSTANQLGIKNGDVVASKNFFQLQSAGNATITANQLLFNGSYLVGVKASKTYRDLATKNANVTRETTMVQVTKAYFGVVINKERIKLFDANISRVDTLLKNTIALNQNGMAESIDVDRIRVNLNNLRAERERFLNVNELGLELLKFQMNYPMERQISVVGNIEDLKLLRDISGLKEQWSYTSRPDYQALEASKRLQELNIKNKFAAYYPIVSAFGTLGWSTQSPNIAGIFKTNSGFKDNGYIGPDKWYNFSQVGLNMNIPIFSGGQRHYQVQEEKLALLKMNNNFQNLKNSVDLDIKQSTLMFENALKTLNIQQENMDLAERVAKVTRIKYEQGVGTNLEVVDAENSLRTAQNNYYQSLYDAMLARVDVQKAYGKILPNAPVE